MDFPIAVEKIKFLKKYRERNYKVGISLDTSFSAMICGDIYSCWDYHRHLMEKTAAKMEQDLNSKGGDQSSASEAAASSAGDEKVAPDL